MADSPPAGGSSDASLDFLNAADPLDSNEDSEDPFVKVMRSSLGDIDMFRSMPSSRPLLGVRRSPTGQPSLSIRLTPGAKNIP